MAKQAAVQQLQVKAEETAPTREAIAVLAYSLWQDRGCPEGSPEQDWFDAEHMLKPADEDLLGDVTQI